MATATQPVLTIDKYLSKSLKPDMEYLEGQLKLKASAEFIHGRVCALLCMWFYHFEKQYGFASFLGARVQVSPTRVRLLDFALYARGPLAKRAFKVPPLLAIEVLTDEDRYKDLIERAEDLRRMGCNAVWLLDPEGKTLQAWSGKEWMSIAEQKPMTPAGAPFDLPWLWQELALHMEEQH